MKRLGVFVAGMVAVGGLAMLVVSSGAEATSTSPTVSSVSPQHGPTGGGTLVTIMGTNLAGTTNVAFGGFNSPDVINRTNNRIQAVAPGGSVGSVDVEVTTSAGTSVNTPADLFTYVTGPTIQSVRPNEGSTLGGNKVYISGADFVAPCTVTFNTTSSSTVTVASVASIVAVAPAGAVGTVPVSVSCASGTTPTDSAAQYTYALPSPTITGVVFDVGSTGGGENVDIYGTKFLKGATVSFGGNPATVVSITRTRIVATAPAGSAGEVDVSVVTSRGASKIVPQDVYFYSAACPCHP